MDHSNGALINPFGAICSWPSLLDGEIVAHLASQSPNIAPSATASPFTGLPNQAKGANAQLLLIFLTVHLCGREWSV